ncbi:MAG: nitroreductase family protein [Lachnospiraceae bacterium]|nr:nitroreductase family protein [Lachnospiraceae bacterium]
MDILQAIEERHSVRAYTEKKIEDDIKKDLEAAIQECNEESGLHMQGYFDEPEGFQSRMAHYGKFRNVRNYIILAGKDAPDLEEKCGYYGEKLVLKAQQLGLNTCWVALTYNKKSVKNKLEPGDRLCLVIAVGYGETQGVPHKGKSISDVVATKGEMPDWFRKGVEAALLAPTAVNQQKFAIGMVEGKPAIKVSGRGFHTKVDLGIVKYHFEVASGHKAL